MWYYQLLWLKENGGLIVVVVCIMHIYKPKQIQQGPQTSFVLVKTSNADEQIICQVNIHIGWAKSFSKAAKWLLLLTSPSLSHDPLQATGCADPNRRGEPQDPNTQSGQTRLLLKTDLLCGAIIVCSHICLTFLHCVFSNASSNCISEKMHTHISCICLVFVRDPNTQSGQTQDWPLLSGRHYCGW